MAKITPEGAVKKAINAYLAAHGDAVFVYMPVPTAFGKRFVDYVVSFYGLYLAIEAKAGDKEATPLQLKSLSDVIKSGGCALLINEANQQEMFAFLDRLAAHQKSVKHLTNFSGVN